ncbi:MAG: hypothetical protein ACRC37_00155 [Lentisphaeria bacterium]
MRIGIFLIILVNSLYADRFVTYEKFGARGDGKSDDFAAIVVAHKFANEQKLPVNVKSDGVYYIGGKNLTAMIETDTNFGSAKFIIDDREVENRGAAIFIVRSGLKERNISVESLQKGQGNIGMELPERSVVFVENFNVKNFIRSGGNQNSGNNLSDIFIVEKDGTIDKKTPIIWDF